MPTILYDTGTCTGSCAVTDPCAVNHAWHRRRDSGCLEIRSTRNRITLVTPLSSEDYRSITKRFAVSCYCPTRDLSAMGCREKSR